MFKYLSQIWNSRDLRKKILFTLGIIIVDRLLVHIPIPGVDIRSLAPILDKNKLLGIFSLLTGGSSQYFSIVLMGLSPYINASIIIQLLTVVIPQLESLSKEGEQGRNTLNKYTRWLTLPLALLQSYGMILLLNSQANVPIVQNTGDLKIMIPIMLSVTTGTVFLMWLGELITEKGIGNGISILIFTGIIAGVPNIIGPTLSLGLKNQEKLIPFVILILLTLIMAVFVILVTEGYRKIPVTYAGHRTRGEQSVLPIRINQVGMIPIIFAVSVVTFPSLISQLFFTNSNSTALKAIGNFMNVQLQTNTITYLVLYFLLIIAFSYFYVSITFNPDQVAENIQKRGGFIPGIRPGKQTSEYLGKVSNRLNLFGSLFLALIATLPLLFQRLFSTLSLGSIPMLISGAGMIIVAGVVLELIRQINSQLVMHDYEKLY